VTITTTLTAKQLNGWGIDYDSSPHHDIEGCFFISADHKESQEMSSTGGTLTFICSVDHFQDQSRNGEENFT
jgi:hypothetical protein